MKSTRKVMTSRLSDNGTGLDLLLDCGCQKRARFNRVPYRTTCYKCPPKRPTAHGWYPWKTIEVGMSFEIKVKSARTMVAHANDAYSPRIFSLSGTSVTRLK